MWYSDKVSLIKYLIDESFEIFNNLNLNNY